MSTQGEKFLAEWQRLEGYLRGKYGGRAPDRREGLQLLLQDGVVTKQQYQFLESCRLLRNAGLHDNMELLSGGIALPTEAAVEMLRRIVVSLVQPPRFSDVAPKAVHIKGSMPVRDAVALMREEDYSQLPVPVGDQHTLFTRHHVASWLEAEAAAELDVILDMRTPVEEVMSRTGLVFNPCAVLPPQTELSTVVGRVERAAADPTQGYPVVLGESRGKMLIFALDDLPKAYTRLGR